MEQKPIQLVCACGCGKIFKPFGIYRKRRVEICPDEYVRVVGKRGGEIFVPRYIRGHHPNCQKPKPAWNKGLTKEICPTLTRMGYQKGHKPFNDWSHVAERQRNDPEYRKRWLVSKKGQIPWNKGKKKNEYKNGIKSGKAHGNWCGGRNGLRDTSVYRDLLKAVRKRDNYTCQKCGDRNHRGRGSRIVLDVHHVVAYSENTHLADNPLNLTTLCRKCHIATDNYGTKLIHKRRKKTGGK